VKAHRPYHRHCLKEILEALQGEGTPQERIEKAQAVERRWHLRLGVNYKPVGKTAVGMSEYVELVVALGIGKSVLSDGTVWYQLPGEEHGTWMPAEEAIQHMVRNATTGGARDRWLESVRFGTECVVRRLVASKAAPESIRYNIEGLRRSAAQDKLQRAPDWDNFAHEYVSMADDFIKRWEAGEYDDPS
jgi:hypothetical protein